MPILEFFSDSARPVSLSTGLPQELSRHAVSHPVRESTALSNWSTSTSASRTGSDAAWSNYWQVDPHPIPRLGEGQEPRLAAECDEKRTSLPQPSLARRGIATAAEPAQWTIDQTRHLEPGKCLNIDLRGAGVIRQMRIRVEPATPEVLRGTRMRIRWDGAASPSVDVPIGHFFGHAYSGHGRWFTSKAAVLGRKPLEDSPYVDYPSAYNSLLLGVTDREAYSRFPMPFANGAMLTIENRSGSRIENTARADSMSSDSIVCRPNWGRFHATCTEAPAAADKTPVFGPRVCPARWFSRRKAEVNTSA